MAVDVSPGADVAPAARLPHGVVSPGLRVAMVSREYPPFGGGIGTYTQKTARALVARGHEVHIFSEMRDGRPAVTFEDGVVVHSLPPSNVRPREARVLRRAWVVARALEHSGPFDVVQAAEWDGEAAIYALTRGASLITRISTPHYLVSKLNGWDRREQRRQFLLRLMERWQTRRSGRIISPSRAMADIIARDWKIDPARIRVVPTGIRLPSLRNDEGEPPTSPPPYILYFGRLEVRKGVQTWIDALPSVLPRWPLLRAVFVGEDLGIAGRSFSAYAAERYPELVERLEFLARLPHARLFPLIRAAELVVLPSRWENLPNTCLETMALGRPVVATTGSAFEELVDHDVSAMLVPPDDSRSLADAVNQLLADPAQRRRIGAAARQRAGDFDIDRMVGRLEDVYRDGRRMAAR